MSLTPREHLKLHGALPAAQLEDLIDWQERTADVSDVSCYLTEAGGQYPAEEFLSSPIGRLHALAKKLCGDNRAELLAIIETLDDVAQTTFNAADYGRSELRKAMASLEELKRLSPSDHAWKSRSYIRRSARRCTNVASAAPGPSWTTPRTTRAARATTIAPAAASATA